MKDGYLLDTNHMGAALRPVSVVRDRIYRARRDGSRFGTCIPVLCELEVGILQLHRPEEYRRDLARLMTQVRLWPLDDRVVARYGLIYQDLRRRGRALSQVDMMLAAMASVLDLILLTSDRDFEALPEIRAENWTS